MSAPGGSRERKGPGLELRTAAYFQGLGYLVRRGVKLAVAAGSAGVTDIDVLAIRFSVPLAEEKLIADCKDRKKPKPYERVLWTRGLASFARVDRAVWCCPACRGKPGSSARREVWRLWRPEKSPAR